MAVEDKYIRNRTTVLNDNGNLTILTSYQKEDVLNLICFISNNSQTIEGKQFLEGDLGYTIEGSNDFFSLSNENLIVSSTDTDKYSVDDDGYLILTT